MQSHPSPPRVFISYSHDSRAHANRVLDLSNRLRADGVDCIIDQYVACPEEGWPQWMESQLRECAFTLVICTETYRQRFEGRASGPAGHGARWEGAIITQVLYEGYCRNKQFVPCVLAASQEEHVPLVLRSVTRHVLSDDAGYESLYRFLTGQPEVTKPPLGALRAMAPLRRHDTFDMPEPPMGAESSPASAARGTLTTSRGLDPVALHDGLYSLRVFARYDEAAKLLASECGQFTNAADRAIVQILREDIATLVKMDRNELSEAEKRQAFQVLYNTLNAPHVAEAAKTAILPPWLFDAERERLGFQLAHSAAVFDADFREIGLGHANRMRDAFVASGRRSLATLVRLLFQLLNLGELAHARQALLEGFALAPDYAPLHVAACELLIYEQRYTEALEAIKRGRECDPRHPPGPVVYDLESYCHFFLGHLERAAELAAEGLKHSPEYTALRNNLAFARARMMMRDLRIRVWDDPERAKEILDDFLSSITKIGAFGTAHFNYALLLYWAKRSNCLDIAREVVAKHGRSDLVASPDMAAQAFLRAKNVLHGEHDHFHATMAAYFAERAAKKHPGDLASRILDEFLWDADNFMSARHAALRRLRAVATKDRHIEGPIDYGHLATLKRWLKDSHSAADSGAYQDGGGYFLRWKNHGVVVNPGAGFLNVFQRRGYAASEISAVLVTSSDYSAYEELRRLLELVAESAHTRPQDERVAVFLERRVHQRFPDVHGQSIRGLLGPQVLIPGMPLPLGDGAVVLEAVDTCSACRYMTDPPGMKERYERPSVVAMIHLNGDHEQSHTVAFLNDVCASGPLPDALSQADVFVVSVGSLAPAELFEGALSESLRTEFLQLFKDDELYMRSYGILTPAGLGSVGSELYKKADCEVGRGAGSVGLHGIRALAERIAGQQKIVVLGDLPMYLGDKRHRVAAVLNEEYRKRPMFVTEDVGLVVEIARRRILCEYEFALVPYGVIDEHCLEGEPSGAVKHFCGSHRGEPGFSSFLRRSL